jgi:hypothetical protein
MPLIFGTVGSSSWVIDLFINMSQEPQILLANLTVTTLPFLRYPEKVTVS